VRLRSSRFGTIKPRGKRVVRKVQLRADASGAASRVRATGNFIFSMSDVAPT